MGFSKLNQLMVILFLGGEDFDDEIVNYLIEEFKKDNGIDLENMTS